MSKMIKSSARACLFGCFAAALLAGCATTHTADSAAVDPLENAIRKTPMEQEHSMAAESDRVLLVFGTADWCGPCRQMKANTWTDPRVGQWMQRHAIVYYLDVNAERELSDDLDIQFMPQIIAYRNGEELARLRGNHGADSCMRWLNQLN